MEKIRLGKTNMMVSRLGLGGLPLQRLPEEEAIAVIRGCLHLGVNFIDTAHGYSNSEERIGKAISGRRENVFLATKSVPTTCDELENNLQLSLERFGVEYIDLYQLHDVSDFKTLEMALAPKGFLAVLEKARKAGVIRHIGASSHQIDVAKAMVRSGRFETIMFPFNFINCEPADELLPLAREHDVGFIVMKPLAGGRLTNAAVAFRYLFQFPDVLPIPGIEKVSQIEEIVQLLEGSHELTDADQQEMQRWRKELSTSFCHRCDYCQPCTQEIRISMVLYYPFFAKGLPAGEATPEWYAEIMEKAAACIEDGECEARCPYHLPIREMIAESYKLYEAVKRKSQE